MIRGLRFARAAYTAAVYPAGPEPMMMTFRTSVMDATLQGDVRQWPSASGRPAMARTSSYEPGFPGATNVMPTRPARRVSRVTDRADRTDQHRERTVRDRSWPS